LLNNILRSSLENQVNQNFTLITLWGEQWFDVYSGGELKNEHRRIVRKGINEHDESPGGNVSISEGKIELPFCDQISDIVKEYSDEDVNIVTNIDCDDCVRFDYVDVIQREYIKYVDNIPFYLDIKFRQILDMEDGNAYSFTITGPDGILSVIEKDIKCYPIRYAHSRFNRYVSGKKHPELYGLVTIKNGSNIFNTKKNAWEKYIIDKSINISDYGVDYGKIKRR
jgi:hypothetical protein